MVAYFALFFSIVSLIFFIVILIRFKKLFSTEKLVDKTQRYIEKMVSDMNNQAMRDIDLVRNNSQELKNLILQTENTIKNYNEATDRLRNMISQVDNLKIESADKSFYNSFSNPNLDFLENNKVHYQENKNVAPLKTVSQRNKENLAKRYGVNNSKINPDATYEVVKSDYEQKSLFDDIDRVTLTQDGAAYKEVPLIHTKNLDEKPTSNNYINIESKSRTLADKVGELFAQSYPVEQIAKLLNCSVTEVQTIIDLGI